MKTPLIMECRLSTLLVLSMHLGCRQKAKRFRTLNIFSLSTKKASCKNRRRQLYAYEKNVLLVQPLRHGSRKHAAFSLGFVLTSRERRQKIPTALRTCFT